MMDTYIIHLIVAIIVDHKVIRIVDRRVVSLDRSIGGAFDRMVDRVVNPRTNEDS